MPITDRELRTNQENKLFELYYMIKLHDNGDIDKLGSYLKAESEKAQSGMTAEEIDAVKQRVSRVE